MQKRDLPFFRNYIENGSFEWPESNKNKIKHTIFDQWEESGTIRLVYQSGFNFPGPDSRNSIFGHSILLQSDSAFILQKVQGLIKGQLYHVGVYVKDNLQTEVELAVKSGDKIVKVSSKKILSNGGWKLLELKFLPADSENNFLSIRKYGQEDVYIDNVGLFPDLISLK